ncbi:molecular chaperone [Citrobacter amalonaticus]|uniref:Molecular chaperone n=1 Tax=Citrobacter amalonaticus TaxID=35703 RepID=A0A8I0MK48_CITAM|nr:molecular chaperone [Citrobacter amalonaticus]ELK6625212.1 molecular chaperone [Citrobacter amalonaticus]MBE0128420.1 molecular chaperone [Citrobacter amalonaticus]HDZ8012779.1 molecular chaperone [Citrobacter amalonaticus]
MLRKLMMLAVLFFPVPLVNAGGISLGQTRVVIFEGGKSATLHIINADDTRYLIKSGVSRDIETDVPVPFIITPPLFIMESNSQQLVRIMSLGDSESKSQESLYYISVLAIPAQQKDKQIVGEDIIPEMSIGTDIVIKLFHRPRGLNMTSTEAPCKMRVEQLNNEIVVTNPTPYYLTLADMEADGMSINMDDRSAMLAPMSNQRYSIRQKAQIVKWQTINDYGGLSDLCEQRLD